MKLHFGLFILIFLLVITGCGSDISTPSSNDHEDDLTSKMRNRIIPAPQDQNVWIAAHQGHSEDTPENSISGIKRCIDLGINIIEIDVRITKDDQLVLMHDKTLDRTTTGTGNIIHFTVTQLKELALIGTNETIPTLIEALQIIKGEKVFVFIDKAEYSTSTLALVSAALEQTETKKQCLLMDFLDANGVNQTYGKMLENLTYVPGVHHSIKELGNYILNLDKTFSPPIYVFWIKDESSPVIPYIAMTKGWGCWTWINTTENDQSAGHTDLVSLTDPDNGWGWAINKGANIILTHYPEKLLEYLTRKGLRKNSD